MDEDAIRAQRIGCCLTNVNFEYGVRMLVSPRPIRLLILRFEFREIRVLAVVLLYPNTVGTILMSIPRMIVIKFFIMVLAIIGSQRSWCQGDWGKQRSTQQRGIQETVHKILLTVLNAIPRPRFIWSHSWLQSVEYKDV